MSFLPALLYMMVVGGFILLIIGMVRGANGDETPSAASTFDQDSHLDDDTASSPICSSLDDDSPARGLWDPTSIYYDHFRDD